MPESGSAAEKFERVEVYVSEKGRSVAFEGRKIAENMDACETAYLTAKGAIAVYIDTGHENSLEVFEDFDAFAGEVWPSDDLKDAVAHALGEKYVEELDI
jgi:hypothetical protein